MRLCLLAARVGVGGSGVFGGGDGGDLAEVAVLLRFGRPDNFFWSLVMGEEGLASELALLSWDKMGW
jgi:hypothetical protein